MVGILGHLQGITGFTQEKSSWCKLKVGKPNDFQCNRAFEQSSSGSFAKSRILLQSLLYNEVIGYMYTCIPSRLNLLSMPHSHPSPRGHHRAPSGAPCVTRRCPIKLPISHVVVFICQCYSPTSSHPHLPLCACKSILSGCFSVAALSARILTTLLCGTGASDHFCTWCFHSIYTKLPLTHWSSMLPELECDWRNRCLYSLN